MNTCCRICILLAGALTMPAIGAPMSAPVFDEYGLEKDPVCDYALPESLKAMHTASTIRRKRADWRLED